MDDNLHIVEQTPVPELSLQLAPLVLAHLVEDLKLAHLVRWHKRIHRNTKQQKRK